MWVYGTKGEGLIRLALTRISPNWLSDTHGRTILKISAGRLFHEYEGAFSEQGEMKHRILLLFVEFSSGISGESCKALWEM